MNGTEFYNMMIETLKREMIEQAEKASAARDEGKTTEYFTHIGASNKCEQLLRMVYSLDVN